MCVGAWASYWCMVVAMAKSKKKPESSVTKLHVHVVSLFREKDTALISGKSLPSRFLRIPLRPSLAFLNLLSCEALNCSSLFLNEEPQH